jgi:DNA segregation ATPase FtsK/SpoIIIE, S-DNA-T family
MAKNSITPKEIETEKEQEKSTVAQTRSTKKTSKEDVTEEKLSAKLVQKFDLNRFKKFIGITLILISIFLLLGCLSYFFTWKNDQDRVLNKSLVNFLFDTNPEPVSNWTGKLGAWTSHLLMYRLFGVASIGMVYLLFLVGSKTIFNYTPTSLRKSTMIIALGMVWFSIFFGYFTNQINHTCGAFGFHVNQWLMLSVGKFGAFLVVGVLLYITLLILFNPDYKAFWNKISGKTPAFTNASTPTNMSRYDDILIHNTIKDDQIVPENKRDAVVFSVGEDNEEEMVEPILKTIDVDDDGFADLPPISKTKTSTGDLEFEIDIPHDDFDIITPREKIEIDPTEGEFIVDIAKQENELSSEELSSIQQEYGDYDPTLELSGYILPPIDLLTDYGGNGININKEELEANKNKIVETLSHYKIDIAKIKATVGPTVTLYEIVPAPGVRISKIKNLEDDIALSLSALGIRIIAPIPGKGTIGIEVPNSNPEMVSMRSLIASEKFQNCDYELPIVMGKTITNETFCFDLAKMPHLLVAGATGQGKSVGLNAIIASILYKKHPSQVKFVLVDPKKVELTLFNKIERHFLAKLPDQEEAIITDTSKVVNTLNSLCIEMDNRYELLKEAAVRNIKEYNEKFIARRLNPEKGHRYLPYIIVLIDEFADLIMTAGKEVEHPIARIAQLARAIGIHLIVATQRPSVNVITGMIKANFPARMAFRVLSKIDSRTILDASGADQLIGRGDMLISTGSDLKRLQCGFLDTNEVEALCDFIGNQKAYPEALLLPEYNSEGSDGGKDVDINDIDPMFAEAAQIVVTHQQGSASLLQRKLKLGYNRAGRIVDQLEGFNIIGPFQGSKARDVLYTDLESLNEYLKVKNII